MTNTLDHVIQKDQAQKIVEAMATKFSECFSKSMAKKYKFFFMGGLTHLYATPTFKNRSETYGPPCTVVPQPFQPRIL